MDVPERRCQVLLCPPKVVMQVQQKTSVLFCDILSGLSSPEGKGCQLHLPRIIPPVAFFDSARKLRASWRSCNTLRNIWTCEKDAGKFLLCPPKVRRSPRKLFYFMHAFILVTDRLPHKHVKQCSVGPFTSLSWSAANTPNPSHVANKKLQTTSIIMSSSGILCLAMDEVIRIPIA